MRPLTPSPDQSPIPRTENAGGVAVGRFASVSLTVIYTDRRAPDGTPERRIISVRVSKRRERKTYEQAYPEA